MAGQRIGVDVDDEAVRKAIERLVGAIAVPRKAMDQIGSHLAAATLLRFERETGPDGKPWLKSLRAQAENGQTLTKSGRLRGSITHNVAADGRAVEVGSNVIYAAIHQFGGEAGRGKSVTLPARPYLGIDERNRAAIFGIVSRALAQAATP